MRRERDEGGEGGRGGGGADRLDTKTDRDSISIRLRYKRTEERVRR